MGRPALDFDADDFDVLDGVEAVVVQALKADGGYDAVYQCRAVCESESDGGLSALWHLYAPDHPGEVVPGWRLLDDCEKPWTVERAERVGFLDQWRLATAYLPDRADVLRDTRPAGQQTDDAGFRVPVLTAVYSGVPGRLEETLSVSDPGGFGGRGDRRQFSYKSGRRLSLRGGDVLRVTRADTGATEDYAVVGASEMDRPDQLGRVLLTRPDATE